MLGGEEQTVLDSLKKKLHKNSDTFIFENTDDQDQMASNKANKGSTVFSTQLANL